MALCYPCINLSFLFSASILRAVIWLLKVCNLSACDQLPNILMLGKKSSIQKATFLLRDLIILDFKAADALLCLNRYFQGLEV